MNGAYEQLSKQATERRAVMTEHLLLLLLLLLPRSTVVQCTVDQYVSPHCASIGT